MNKVYHCRKNPEHICQAASMGTLDFSCDACSENEPEKAKFIVLVSSSYLRDTQVFNPDVPIPDEEEDEDAFLETLEDSDNWRDFETDGYLGIYEWVKSDVDGLKAYVAKKRGFQECILEIVEII